MKLETLTLQDGRQMEVASAGDPNGTTILLHHGTPGSRLLIENFADLAQELGLFLVATSRAGYGKSTPLPGRTVGDVVRDAHDVLDQLGRTNYVSVGWSGGGPHTLACAVLGAPRCVGSYSLAGVAPVDVNFDWTEGMGPENVEEFRLAQEGGPEYLEHVAEAGRTFAVATKDDVIDIFGGLLSEADLACFATEEDRERFAALCRDAFSTSEAGFLHDDNAFMKSWGFDLSTNTTPVHVWYGDQDLMVPTSHGEWLSGSVPNAKGRFFSGAGHVTLVTGETARELMTEIAGTF